MQTTENRYTVNGVSVNEIKTRRVARPSVWNVNVKTGPGSWTLGVGKPTLDDARRAVIVSLERQGHGATARALEVGYGFRAPTPTLDETTGPGAVLNVARGLLRELENWHDETHKASGGHPGACETCAEMRLARHVLK